MRNISASVEQQVLATSSKSAHLLEITFNDGTDDQVLYLNTSAWDITTSGAGAGIPNEEWIGLGLPGGQTPLGIGVIQETSETRSQQVEIVLDGVDQNAIAAIQQFFFRGRTVRIWKVWFNEGQIVASTMVFSGFQNDNWDISESRGGDGNTVTVSTRLVSRLAVLQRTNPVLTNVRSHNAMLNRAGIDVSSTMDMGFSQTPELVNLTIRWGDIQNTRVRLGRGLF